MNAKVDAPSELKGSKDRRTLTVVWPERALEHRAAEQRKREPYLVGCRGTIFESNALWYASLLIILQTPLESIF